MKRFGQRDTVPNQWRKVRSLPFLRTCFSSQLRVASGSIDVTYTSYEIERQSIMLKHGNSSPGLLHAFIPL